MRKTRSGAQLHSPPPVSKPTTSNTKRKKKQPVAPPSPPKTTSTRGTRRLRTTSSTTLQPGAPPTPDNTQQNPNRTSTSESVSDSDSDSDSDESDDAYLPDPDILDLQLEPHSPGHDISVIAQTSKPRKSRKPARQRQKRPRIEEFTANRSNHNVDDRLEEDVDDDLLTRLERTLGTYSNAAGTSSNPAASNPAANTTENPTIANSTDVTIELPTLLNYKSHVNAWSQSRISDYQQGKTLGTAVPRNIFEEAKAIQKLYKKQKAVLSLVANISIFTLDKALGELGSTRAPDCLRLWSSYAIKALETKMPNGSEKGALGERNRKLAALWKGLSKEEKRVWDPPIFYLLSGLPRPRKPELDSDDEEGQEIHLTPEERADLQKLYDEMVCTSKVSQAYNKVASGIPNGPSLANYNRRSLKCVQKLHNQIENESNHMDFAYYFLAASTRSATQAGSEGTGWCQEYTSHKDLADYVRQECNFPTVFATHTQGLSVERAVASAIGKNKQSETTKTVSSGDKVKGDLALLLRSQLGLALGIEVKGFPRGPDPAQLLPEKGYPVRLIQEDGSTLPPEVLKLGFKGMNSKRSLWLNDAKAGLFRFEKISADDGDDSQLDQANEDEPDTPAGDLNIEEEEWHGLDDEWN